MNNNSEEVHEISGIGPVVIKRSLRARYLNISVKPFKGVRVSVPLGMSYKSAARIVNLKRDWILDAIRKVEQVEKKQQKFTADSEFRTKHHKLSIKAIDGDKVIVRVKDGIILVSHPGNTSPDTEEVQFVIRKGIVEALGIEARDYLPGRVRKLAAIYGFEYGKLALKNIKSRWGSCSRVNNINLSIHLMTLPDHLVDYVILHELVHTRIKNHSTKFWKELDKVCPGSKVLDKELQSYRITIH